MSGLRPFSRAFARSPVRALLRLGAEYAGFVAACLFVVALVASRFPLALVDRATGLRLRDRIVDAIARVSPG